MADNKYTHLAILVDRSGSMQDIARDMEGGLMQLIEKQKKEPGKVTASVAQFDTVFEYVHKNKSLNEIDSVRIEPRGGTALNDAMAKLIDETGVYLANMKENDRPGNVVFISITDGDENSSREFTREQVKQKVTRQANEYKWQFLHLGADFDAWGESGSLGVAAGAALNYAKCHTGAVMNLVSNKLSAYRGAKFAGMDDAVVESFTAEERQSVES